MIASAVGLRIAIKLRKVEERMAVTVKLALIMMFCTAMAFTAGQLVAAVAFQ